MKTGVHPNYYNAQVSCACGNSFVTRSTKKVIKLEICGGCHPFYTGKQRLVDTAGRVERFKKRFAATEGKTIERKPKAEIAMKKLDTLTSSSLKKKKILSTAPTQEELKGKPAAKDAKDAKKKEPAKKD
ncbi:MAG TPA: 50S ribosomal protein L31 [Elusimicrobiota bacterium]|nr:50S ribosomal protein L31 [Elusimicrobiota bacterium]